MFLFDHEMDLSLFTLASKGLTADIDNSAIRLQASADAFA
jgi:hypothetical protein